MATKPQLKAAYPTGAPDSAKRLEAAEAQAAAKRERLEEELDKLELELKQADGDTEREKEIDEKITRVVKSLLAQTKMWIELAKQVNSFYKTVDESKRDGEKILRADVERILTNAWRFQRLGRESFVIGIAQEAIHSKDEMDFYAKYAELIRGCEIDSLRAGVDNEKFPQWCIDCYEKAL